MLTVTRARLVEAMVSTGSRDQDVLYAAIEAATTGPRRLRRLGQCAVAIGGMLCVSGGSAPLGAPLAVAGGWLWHASSRELSVASSTYREYLFDMSSHNSQPSQPSIGARSHGAGQSVRNSPQPS